MTIRVKANRSSETKTNMESRHCNTKEEESQDHLGRCTGTEDLRKNLDMTKEHDHMVLLRRLTRKLRDIIKKEEHEKTLKKLL